MGLQGFMKKIVQGGQAKASQAGPMIAWSHVGRPKWTPRRYEALAEEGFRKNVVAYRCISLIARAVATVPWVLYKNNGVEVGQHPLIDLLDRPNPLQDGVAFIEALVADYLISGNAYIEAVASHDDDLPCELYLLRPDRMKIVPGNNGLPQAYEYTVSGKVSKWSVDPLSARSPVLHIKSHHPLDDWYGFAPLEAALLSIDQHNAAGAWNQALLNQGARPSGALVYAPKEGPANLSDEQMGRLREEIETHYSGRSAAGRPLILEGGLQWHEMSLSPKEMDWSGGRDAAARDIALAFGVPVQLIGIQGAQTYANMQEARLALYEETVLPLAGKILAAFEAWLAPLAGGDFYMEIDKDEVSALTARRDVLWDKLQRSDFLTVNEKREALGYGPVEGGDVLASIDKGE